MSKDSIVFFGSGPVAAKSLQLLSKSFSIEAIVTKPSTVQQMTSTLKDARIYSVSNKTELDNLISTKPFGSKLAVLIDFGIIVSKAVIDSFPLGIINSHFSVLPELRGADPISFAILSGQPKTGVSLMFIDEGMDTGKILTAKSLVINPSDTTPTLTDKLITLSNNLLGEYIPLYILGEISPRSQSHPDRATYSRKLTKEDGLIDWTKPAEVIEREIRAFIEWPKSYTQLAGKDVTITAVRLVKESGAPGNIGARAKEIIIYCGKDALSIDKLKPAGKNEMTSEAFLAGHKHLF